jgi:hypothetical protein
MLDAWRIDYNHNNRPHSWLGQMSPAIYAAQRQSAAPRSTDGSAPRTAVTTAQKGITDGQTPIPAG